MRHGNRSPAVPQARRAIISVTSGSGGRAPGLCVLRDLPRFAHGARRPRRRRPCLDRHEHETAARELMLFRILPRRILRYALTISPASLPRRHACILTTISPDTGMDAPAGAGSTDADAGWAVQRVPRRADARSRFAEAASRSFGTCAGPQRLQNTGRRPALPMLKARKRPQAAPNLRPAIPSLEQVLD